MNCMSICFLNYPVPLSGMFPWVCLATMPLFYPFDWPKRVASYSKIYYTKFKKYICNIFDEFIKKTVCGCKTNKPAVNDEYAQENEDTIDNEQEEIKETKESTKDDENNVCSILAKVVDDNMEKRTNDKKDEQQSKNNSETIGNDVNGDYKKKKLTMLLILFHVLLQAFLPYSHFITKVRKESLINVRSLFHH